jgi:hypothetical protein
VLLFVSCPTYVSRSVVAIVIYTVKRKARRAFSDVGQESRKIVFPLFANLYSATAVIFILSVIWVTASIAHAAPYPVKRVCFSGFSEAVLESSVVTSTGCCVAASNFFTDYDTFSAAVTLTVPLYCTVFAALSSGSNCDKSAETLASYIFKLFSDTSAPARVGAAADIIASSGMCASAITLAEPENAAIFLASSWPDCDQSTKTLSRDILEIGHRSASSVRGSSGEMALGTSSRCAL